VRQGAPRKKPKLPEFIVFADLLFSGLIAGSIYLLIESLREPRFVPIALLTWIYLIAADDWYGGRFYALKYTYTESMFAVDLLHVLNLMVALHLAATASGWISVSLGVYALLGLAWDAAGMRRAHKRSTQYAVLRVWLFGALGLAAVAAVWANVLNSDYDSSLSPVGAACLIGSWLAWRILLAAFTRRHSKAVF
jgi:hypothetical protein